MRDLQAIRASVELKRRLPAEMISQATQDVIDLVAEVDRLRGLLDYRNREAPHCPTCDCGSAEHPS